MVTALVHNDRHVAANAVQFDRRRKCNGLLFTCLVVAVSADLDAFLQNSRKRRQRRLLRRCICIIRPAVDVFCVEVNHSVALTVNLIPGALQGFDCPFCRFGFVCEALRNFNGGYRAHSIQRFRAVLQLLFDACGLRVVFRMMPSGALGEPHLLAVDVRARLRALPFR